MVKLPAAIFIVDVLKEKIAVKEAQKLGIPIFAMVDTNSDPTGIDYVIPANDDASQSIDIIISVMAEAIKEGLAERKAEREKMKEEKAKKAIKKKTQKVEIEDQKKADDKKEEEKNE